VVTVDIAILLFDDVNALDAIGPYEVLRHLPDAQVRFVAREPGPKHTEDRALSLLADAALDDVASPSVIVVPGGSGELSQRGDERVLRWLRTAHATSDYTTSVCTGALVLAAAGLLDGTPATTHWLAHDELRRLGAVPSSERVVSHGRIVTAAGVSSGIDMALVLAARIAGDEVAQGIQLAIEYDPMPPFDAGAPHKAPAHVVARQRAGSRFAPT
jgi:putative intracellular protease/amidase